MTVAAIPTRFARLVKIEHTVFALPFAYVGALLCVRDIPSAHVPKASARLLYEDLTPPPTAVEIEIRRLERIYRATTSPRRAPDKRARRELRRLKERE